MVICLERRADLHMAQLMPLPLIVSCSSKSRLVPAHLGSPRPKAIERVYVCLMAHQQHYIFSLSFCQCVRVDAADWLATNFWLESWVLCRWFS